MSKETLRILVERFGLGELSSRSVVIVDDEPGNLVVLSSLLEEQYTVHEAESGAEALQLVESVPVDVIVTDQRMPAMTGVELLERVRLTRPDIAGIVLTAYTESPDIIAAINRAQVFRFLTKPWRSEQLLASVASASEHVSQGRAIERLVQLLAERNEALAAANEDLRSTQQRMLHLDRLSTMGRLTAGITHDLRDFLNSVVFVEEELAMRDVADDLREILEVGLSGIRSLLASMRSMNQFARSGSIELEFAPVQVRDILADAITVAQVDMEFRNRRVVVQTAPDLPPLSCERQKLVQVLVNLVRNAIQATQEGQTVWVTAEALDDRVRLVVEDDGPGVVEDQRERLFEPFVSTKGKKGMGMGLYMARLIAELHGGKLRCVAPVQGAGARFELTLGGVQQP